MPESFTLKDIRGRTCIIDPRNIVSIERCAGAKRLFFVRFRGGMWIKIGAAERARLAKCTASVPGKPALP